MIEEWCTKAKIDPAFVSFHSPLDNKCSRWAISHVFEELYVKPPDGQLCCGYCNPDNSYIAQNKSHQLLINSMSEMAIGKGKDPRMDCKYAAQQSGEAKGLVLAKLKGEVVGHTWHE